MTLAASLVSAGIPSPERVLITYVTVFSFETCTYYLEEITLFCDSMKALLNLSNKIMVEKRKEVEMEDKTIYLFCQTFYFLSLSLSISHTHTHTHTSLKNTTSTNYILCNCIKNMKESNSVCWERILIWEKVIIIETLSPIVISIKL